MSTGFTIIMAIAIIGAWVIGWLISDKLGLIKNTKINNKPNDNSGPTDNTNQGLSVISTVITRIIIVPPTK